MFEAIYLGEERVEIHTSAGSVYIDTSRIEKEKVRSSEPGISYDYEDTKRGIILRMADKCIYHGGAVTFYDELSNEIHAYSGVSQQIDIAFLPVGNKYRQTVSTEEALQIAAWLKPKYVVPLYSSSDRVGQAPSGEVLEFARCIMLEQYGVPKVLRTGQAILL